MRAKVCYKRDWTQVVYWLGVRVNLQGTYCFRMGRGVLLIWSYLERSRLMKHVEGWDKASTWVTEHDGCDRNITATEAPSFLVWFWSFASIAVKIPAAEALFSLPTTEVDQYHSRIAYLYCQKRMHSQKTKVSKIAEIWHNLPCNARVDTVQAGLSRFSQVSDGKKEPPLTTSKCVTD